MVPVSVETSPRELTCSPGELVRSTLQNADPVTSRRRVVGRRTIIPLEPFASPDTVDPVKLDENINDVEVPEAPESSDGGSKKRGVESFDEPVDWFQRERELTLLLNKKSLKLTLALSWIPKSLSVDIHRRGCQRDCQR